MISPTGYWLKQQNLEIEATKNGGQYHKQWGFDQLKGPLFWGSWRWMTRKNCRIFSNVGKRQSFPCHYIKIPRHHLVLAFWPPQFCIESGGSVFRQTHTIHGDIIPRTSMLIGETRISSMIFGQAQVSCESLQILGCFRSCSHGALFPSASVSSRAWRFFFAELLSISYLKFV